LVAEWVDYANPRTKKSPEKVRAELSKLILLAVVAVTAVLLFMVARDEISVEGAVQLAAAVLSPLFTLLGLAVGYYFKGPAD
jgi:hypothetical protein